ncbi:MAG: FKBP-type peptidyl-prolyl cis-trans isomerase N-terminal domain-containing protein [Flavobacteriales bacterium]
MKFVLVSAVLSVFFVLTGCQPSEKGKSSSNSLTLKDQNDSISYAMGMGLSAQYEYFNGDDYRAKPMEMAINHFLNDEEFMLTEDEKNEVVKAYFNGVKTFYEDSLLRRSYAWLEENKKKEGVIVTPRGVQYKYIKKSKNGGESPDGNDVAYIRYTQGSVYRGELWNQSMATNPVSEDTVKLVLNRELSGLSEGIQLMNVGDKVIFWLPPEIGSAEGRDPAQVSKKNEVIYTEVELLKVQNRKTSLIDPGELSQAPGYFINEEERND